MVRCAPGAQPGSVVEGEDIFVRILVGRVHSDACRQTRQEPDIRPVEAIGALRTGTFPAQAAVPVVNAGAQQADVAVQVAQALVSSLHNPGAQASFAELWQGAYGIDPTYSQSGVADENIAGPDRDRADDFLAGFDD